MIRTILLFVFILFATTQAIGQPSIERSTTIANVERNAIYTQDSVTIISDIFFQKKGSNRWLLGNHYRKEWITPVEVPNVLIDTLGGGATAVKETGGKQTKTLRLQLHQNSHRQYVLRSVEKYTEKV